MRRYEPFINRVLDEANERFDINPMGGYRIETTLNREAQGFIYDLMTTDAHFGWQYQDERLLTAVAMIGNDGQIVALAGRDELDVFGSDNIDRGFSLAANGIRQPGSSAKPVWAYGPAMEHLGWGTGTMINDELFAFGGGPGNPLGSGPILRNWDHRFRGRVTVTNAMVQSWNVPAVKAMNAVGDELVVDFVERLGIPPYPEGLYESHAIGTHPVTALQMAGAYSAFANGGTFIEPFTITRITAPNGDIIYEPPHSERVMSEATAYMISHTLRQSLIDPLGTATLINERVPDQWLAGKTGTTDFETELMNRFGMPETAVPEVWFVGYSMDYTVAIWSGYPERNDGTFVDVNEQLIPRNLFSVIMRELNTAGDRSPERPSTVVQHMVEWQSGSVDGEVCFPSGATPGAFTRSEFFHVDSPPTCTSTRFTGGVTVSADVPDAPTNFRVDYGGGTTLNFAWDHSSSGGSSSSSDGNLILSLSEATAARDTAISLTRGQTHITDALRNLNPGEAEANMMIDQINAGAVAGGGGSGIGYAVIGTYADGGTREITGSTSNSVSYSFSIADLGAIQSFHVIARSSGGSSGPSNVVPNNNLVEVSDLEIPVPDMVNWTLEQVLRWADVHGLYREVFGEFSDTIEVDRVISTYPTGSMTQDQVLTIVVSLGPEPELPELPEMPGLPDPEDPEYPADPEDPEYPVDPAAESEDPEANSRLFDISPGLDDIIHIGNFNYSRNGRITQMLDAALERVRREVEH